MNYDYFYDWIQKQEINIDELYDAICCLEIINIRLDMDGNSQLIFESLNSTGLNLSEGAKMCDLPTNALNEIFLKIAFEERSVYLMNSKNKIYILERFENFGTSEDKDVYRHCEDGTYSIEHIMPQHLTPVWQKELGDDYEQIHEQWLHRMANLMLTAYNSKCSNSSSSFTEKKTMQNGFDDSGIRMNTWIAKKDKWALDELGERSEYLMGRALAIWAAPITEYKPEENIALHFNTNPDTFSKCHEVAIARIGTKSEIYALLGNYREKDIVIFKSGEEADKYA